MTARRALWTLIAVSGVLRMAWAASVGPGNDEAYHALFAAHLDWSYVDHPPMMALVEAAGLRLTGGAMSILALRAGFIALFAGSTFLMARLTGRFYGPVAGTIAAFVLNMTAYYGFAASTFALPDGPLLFFWLLTLDRLAAAFEAPERLWTWLEVGLAWGGALLSKYHAVFLPAGALLAILATPSARAILRRPGPYLASAVGATCFAPVVAWNAAHDWSSFAFQGGRALGSGGLRIDALMGAVAGQAIYLLPWIWCALIVSLASGIRRVRAGTADVADRFLICQAALPLTAFMAIACFRPVLPHWSLIGLLPVIPLLGRDWSRRWSQESRRMRWRFVALAVVPWTIAIVVALHVRTGLFQRQSAGGIGLVTAADDPTNNLYGWDQVGAELRRRLRAEERADFLFTSRWYHSGQIAFTAERTPVLCYNRKHAQNFAHWSRPEDWVGLDGIFVGVNDCAGEAAFYARFFAHMKPIGGFRVVRHGATIREVHLYRCQRQLMPFPFDGRDDFGGGLNPVRDVRTTPPAITRRMDGISR